MHMKYLIGKLLLKTVRQLNCILTFSKGSRCGCLELPGVACTLWQAERNGQDQEQGKEDYDANQPQEKQVVLRNASSYQFCTLSVQHI